MRGSASTAEFSGARTVVLVDRSERRVSVDGCMRAKEEKDVRPRLEPRMSPRATEGWTEGESEEGIIGRWPLRGTWEDIARLIRAVRAMRGCMVFY